VAEQQPLNATFFAFQKRDGKVLLPAGVAFAIALLALFAIGGGVMYCLLGGTHFVDWFRGMIAVAAKGGTPSPPPNLSAFFLIVPVQFIMLFLVFVLLASFESSCLRWMIRGQRSGPLNLCFGADMWRVFGTYWFWVVFFVCSIIVFWIYMLLLGLAERAIAGANNPGLAVLVALIACLVWIAGWIYAVVRLAPAAATSIGIGRFAPQDAWIATRGRFWALFGAFLLLFVIYFVASIVISQITMGVFFATIMNSLDWTKIGADPEAFAEAYRTAVLQAVQTLFASPTTIALYIGGALALRVVGLVFYVLFYGVNARAVQAALEEGKLSAPAAA
jgi:hypothetical protein